MISGVNTASIEKMGGGVKPGGMDTIGAPNGNERDKIIKVLKAPGSHKLPDGRSIESIVKVGGNG